MKWLGPTDPERLGYQTQKPEGLLRRIIDSSCPADGIILDAYCGCGTTIAVAEATKREWIGIDITFQSISIVLKRLEEQFGPIVARSVELDGIPKDMASAVALSQKQDDRVRKEFEKWAVLTYTNNRAIVSDRKGADWGVDGTAYFMTSKTDTAKMILQVKSGGAERKDVAALRGDMESQQAELGVLITLQEPTQAMRTQAMAVGSYFHELTGKYYPRIQIVTVKEIIEMHRRLELPVGLDVLKAAQRATSGKQLKLKMRPR